MLNLLFITFFMGVCTTRHLPTSGRLVQELNVCSVQCIVIEHKTNDFLLLYQVLKTTFVLDAGKSLNPAIDIGQIEGGFTQVSLVWCILTDNTAPHHKYATPKALISGQKSTLILIKR